MIRVNEKSIHYQEGTSINDLVNKFKPAADIFIVNGFPASTDTPVHDGDRCVLIKKGSIPTPDEMDSLLLARHTPGVHTKIKNSVVAILGLGGLGSAVAGAMAKIGVGKLLLSDYDVVEPSNLNRQHYFVDQIGMQKTRALQDNLLRMNPSIHLELIDTVLEESILSHFFSDVDVLIECFDSPAMKAATLRSVLREMEHVSYVGSSGMAGYGSNNSIRTTMISPGIYIVGDEKSEARPGMGLMAPRVGIAAHHMANQALRILLGVEQSRQ